MAGLILIFLLVLYFFGYIQVPWFHIPNIVLFTINGQPITLLITLIGILLLWAIGVLPSPLRQIAMILLILWVLGQLGIIMVSGLTNIVVIAVAVGLVVSLLRR